MTRCTSAIEYPRSRPDFCFFNSCYSVSPFKTDAAVL